MNNLKIAGILISLVLVGQMTYSMELEEKAKKQKIAAETEEFFNAILYGNLGEVNKILNDLPSDKQKELVNYVEHFRWPLRVAGSGIGKHKYQRDIKLIYFEIMKSLIAKGADINFFHGTHNSVLGDAADREDWDTVGFLIRMGANPDITGGSPYAKSHTLSQIIDDIIKDIEESLITGYRKLFLIKKTYTPEEAKAQIAIMQEVKKLIEQVKKEKLKELHKAQELQRLYEPKQQQFLEPEFLKSLERQ